MNVQYRFTYSPMATLSELLSKLDDDNRIRGRQFERICKWYLQNAPQYRLLLEKVWLWSEWPDRWGSDAGIDLVAQTHDDKRWAIQAKAYAPTSQITKSDVDTFLSESSREVFSFRLLIATTNLIGSIAQRTLDAQEKPVGKVLLSDLQKSEVVWPESPEKLEAEPPEQKKPHPHQERAISEVCEGFTRNNRGQLIMASGTGKTLVSLWIAEKLQSQRTLVLLPSLSLLGQTLREWTSNASQPFYYLPVCSDDTVRGADRLISKTSDLGLPATTDPDEVVEFLKREGHLIVLATYQSSPVIAEAFKRNNIPSFNLAIADEAHRCAGSVSSPFATILDDVGGIYAQRRLFMTATPRYFTDHVREEAKEIEYEIASMDDGDKFGHILHKLSYSEAIQQDLLSDYRVVIIGVDDPTYREYAEQGAFVTTDGEHISNARILASQIAVGKAMRKYGLRRIITFHSRIKRAKEFSERFSEVVNWMPEEARPEGRIWSKHVSGLMPAGQRDVLLDHFRDLEADERGLLANARCLGEGVDVPSLDGIAFIDPRSSQLDIIQAVGRAIRKTPDKKIGTVVLPVFIDPTQDPEIALSASDFKPIWNVLKALRAHDEVLGEVLDKLRRQLGRDSSTEIDIPEKLTIDLPITVDESFVHALRLKAIERSTATWDFWYGLLERYVEREGYSMVPSKYLTDEGHSLGSWVNIQRKAHGKGELSLERKRLLEKLPGWEWDYHEAHWKVTYDLLRGYVTLEGHSKVPLKYVTKTGRWLGVWVYNQRDAYREGRLSKKRQKLLAQLSGWTWDIELREEPIELSYALRCLCEYADKNGHTDVNDSYVTEGGFHLGKWVVKQRQLYGAGRISDNRKQALEQIPEWTWNHSGLPWQRGIELLREYAEREKHTNVPKNYLTEEGLLLGTWVSAQRGIFRRGRMSVEQQQEIQKIPFWVWDPGWDDGIKHLRGYVLATGQTQVSKGFAARDGFPLGKWVYRQREFWIRGTLATNERMQLERFPGWISNCLKLTKQLPGWLKKHPDTWVSGFRYLRRYADREGHTFIPKDYITDNGFFLGGWVSEQRTAHSKSKLSSKQRRLLEKLPGWVWNVWQAKWITEDEDLALAFSLLREYIDQSGAARLPNAYIAKAKYNRRWIVRCKLKYRAGRLSPKAIWLLENLPGWTWE